MGARKYCFTIAAIVIGLGLPIYILIIYLLEFATGFSRLEAYSQEYEYNLDQSGYFQKHEILNNKITTYYDFIKFLY